MPTAILVHHAYYVLVSDMCHRNIQILRTALMSSYGCSGIDVSVSMQLQVLDLVGLSTILQDILQIVLQKQCILVKNHEFCYLLQKNIPSGTELRYDYGSGKLPRRKVHATFQLSI